MFSLNLKNCVCRRRRRKKNWKPYVIQDVSVYLYFGMDSECDPVSRQTRQVDDAVVASSAWKYHYSEWLTTTSHLMIVFFPSWGNFFLVGGKNKLFLPNTFLASHPARRLRGRLPGDGPARCPRCKGLIYTFLMTKCYDEHWRAGLCNVYHLMSSISGHHRSRHLCFDVCGVFCFLFF